MTSNSALRRATIGGWFAVVAACGASEAPSDGGGSDGAADASAGDDDGGGSAGDDAPGDGDGDGDDSADDDGPASGGDDGDDSADDGDDTAGDDGASADGGGDDGGAEPWQPAPGTTWQWQLTEAIDTSLDVGVYDIDLFDVDASVIDALHGDGRIVICYFSAGSYEEWRPDADEFPEAALGNPLEDWEGERWLDHRDDTVRAIMQARMDLAVDKDCDAVEPDNVDGYANDNGVGLSADDQLDYNGWLADEAHARGLSIGLKNDLDQIDALLPSFDWALNEECVAYDECDALVPFLDAGKAVFHVEYVDDPDDGPALAEQVCDDANALGLSTLVKEWDLGPWGIACWR